MKTATESLLAKLVLQIPAGRRGAVLQSVVSFEPEATFDESFQVGRIRAAFADYWEEKTGTPVPVKALRDLMEPPVPIGHVLLFGKLGILRDVETIEDALADLVQVLAREVSRNGYPSQCSLFESDSEPPSGNGKLPVGSTVSSLRELVDSGRKFPTIYADPPWAYENTSSRAAAENHYQTLSVDEICEEPVRDLAADNAHLHLWTTNAFLRDAFQVIDAWGFQFKSAFLWVKPDIGMGNYWRVSHEFLLLGVRGSLTFKDRTVPSWIEARRTVHSKKPGIVRTLIERVSPGPYLELYGREELPCSAWTVYGNQVERRLF